LMRGGDGRLERGAVGLVISSASSYTVLILIMHRGPPCVDGGSHSKGGPIPCKTKHPRAEKRAF
jgi:hypothetical protein